jgi:hypothetical protein
VLDVLHDTFVVVPLFKDLLLFAVCGPEEVGNQILLISQMSYTRDAMFVVWFYGLSSLFLAVWFLNFSDSVLLFVVSGLGAVCSTYFTLIFTGA